MYTTETFIKKAKEKHCDKYDYSNVDYKDSRTKVCIICREHGEFYQEPSAHLRGYGCPVCSNNARGNYNRLTNEEFIIRSKKIHGEKYDYSKVKYVNSQTKVCIICREHGEFLITPSAHLSGSGCPKCKGRNLTKEELIEKFKLKHGNKYDYSKVNLSKLNEKVIIICPEHGEFLQTPTKHLIGQGCPQCGKQKNRNKITLNEFIDRSNIIHNNKYDYSKVDFNKVHDKITIICPKHGEFTQYVYDHMNGHGCPVCGQIESSAEQEIYEYVANLIGYDKVEKHNRKILSNDKELDIYIPSYKLAIEYNGLKWHSEEFLKNKRYHLSKSEECERLGIRLIQIFEDEYKFHKDIVLSKIRHLLMKDDLPKIMARKCEILEIDIDMAKRFLNNNHIQGFVRATKYYGAFFSGCLIGVMTFLKEKENVWVLNRFATDIKFICQGIGGKLFSAFIKENNPKTVKSFADRRFSFIDNNLYIKLGFKLSGIISPDYKYVNTKAPNRRFHKFNFRKKILNKRYGLSLEKTETEMVCELGYSKIWDCGLYKYEWNR